MKFRSRKFCRRSSKVGGVGGEEGRSGCIRRDDVKWELRPGGMLVQKREDGTSSGEGMINLRVWSGSHFHDVSIESTSTFGELKATLLLMTGLEAREQRLVFKGKEREDYEFLHMIGVKDMDKVLLFQDPSYKHKEHILEKSRHTISV
ncbi:hypothetical protein ACLOJK_009259 [Asimina triloba]